MNIGRIVTVCGHFVTCISFFEWMFIVNLHFGVKVQQMVQDGLSSLARMVRMNVTCFPMYAIQVTWMPTALYHSDWRPTSSSTWALLESMGPWQPVWLLQPAAWCSPASRCRQSWGPFCVTRWSQDTGRWGQTCALWHEALRQMWAVDTCQQTEPNSLSPLPQTSVSQSQPCIFTPHMLKILFCAVVSQIILSLEVFYKEVLSISSSSSSFFVFPSFCVKSFITCCSDYELSSSWAFSF